MGQHICQAMCIPQRNYQIIGFKRIFTADGLWHSSGFHQKCHARFRQWKLKSDRKSQSRPECVSRRVNCNCAEDAFSQRMSH